MSSSKTDEGPPCKRDKKTLDLDEEDRSDSIPHPVVPLSIRDIRLDLNLIPDTVILETMKLISNQDRRELSFTCRRFRNMIIKNKTPEMDRRKIIGGMSILYFRFHPSFEVSFEFSCSRSSYYVKKSFENFTAFEEYVKERGAFFVFEQVLVSNLESLGDNSVDISQMGKVLCGIAHSMSATFSHITIEAFKEWIESFFECPQLKEIEVFPDFGYPEGVWDKYCATVTEKGQAKGIQVRREMDYCSWTCTKLTENRNEVVVVTGNPEYVEEYGHQC